MGEEDHWSQKELMRVNYSTYLIGTMLRDSLKY